MKKQSRVASVFFAAIAIVAFAGAISAQEATGQQSVKPRPSRPDQKQPGDQVTEPVKETAPESSEEALRRSISALANQIGVLTTEVRRLRVVTERSSVMMELLLYEERLAKVEEKIDNALETKLGLDSREQELQRRLKNIQQEMIFRGGGGLRRDEIEASIRADINRALDDTRTQQANYQQRISELQAQATRLRRYVEELRSKIDQGEEKTDAPKQ